MPMDQIHAWDEAEARLFNAMVERNLKGQALERSGKIDEAIVQYEQNLADRFSGNYPYDRLRILYTKRKQYYEAMRVCKAFVNVADALLHSGSQRADLRTKATKFAAWIAKLEASSSNYSS